MNLVRRLMLIISLSLVLCSCKEWWEDKTGAEKVSMGSSYDVLRNRGGFDVFLDAVDLVGYKRLLRGSGLVTLFAPSDQVFREFLLEKFGSADPRDVYANYPNELSLIVSYHMVQFSYNTDELLAWSMYATSENPEWGDGSVYKYQTYARAPWEQTIDPLTGRPVKIYNSEKYLPVFSSKIFSARNVVANAEADYKLFFPNTKWVGTDDQLYVQGAPVTESGIASDNGYIYVIDGVAEPLPTICDALHDEEIISEMSGDYSMFTEMLDRFNLYVYDAGKSADYASPGDSLYLHYTYKSPSGLAEIPEVASESSYLDGGNPNMEKEMRYAVTVFAPTNERLMEYIATFFADFVAEVPQSEYISALTDEAIYHILMAHTYDKRDLILPSELVRDGIDGVWGERFALTEDQILDVKFCANGVIYGIDHFFEPTVFTRISKVAYQYKKYQWWGAALLTKDIIASFIDSEADFTLLIQNDDNLSGQGFTYTRKNPLIAGEYGVECKSGGTVIGEADMRKWVLRNLYTMKVPLDGEDGRRLHYYQSSWYEIFIFVRDYKIYCASDGDGDASNRVILNVYEDLGNGKVVEIDKTIQVRQALGQWLSHGNMARWKEFMGRGNSLNSDWGGFNFVNIMTITGLRATPFSNATERYSKKIPLAYDEEGNVIPYVEEGSGLAAARRAYQGAYADTLEAYMKYFALDMYSNNISTPILPGIDARGNYLYGDEYAAGWDDSLITYSHTGALGKRFKMRISWKPTTTDDEYKFKIYDRKGGYLTMWNGLAAVSGGHWPTSSKLPMVRTNGSAYTIEGSPEQIFDYRDIFIEEYPSPDRYGDDIPSEPMP